jgi:hypothetical protein
MGEGLIDGTRTRGSHARAADATRDHRTQTRWTTAAARRRLGDTPEESDMSLMDVGAIAGALVFLALLGFVFYKRCMK